LRETAHLFGAERSLFGIVTHPHEGSALRTGVIILNAGQVHHAGPNRVHVGVARHLAKAGFISARIDQSGKGESPVRSGLVRTESLLQDFDDVEDYMSTLGVDRYVIFGLCSGADDALIIAHQRQQVLGLALLDSFVEHNRLRYVDYVLRTALDFYWVRHAPRNVVPRVKGLLLNKGNQVDVRDWDEPEIMNGYYNDFIDRGGNLITIFTHGARYYSRRGQLASSLGAKRGLKEIYLKDASHTYSERAHREKMYSHISEWMLQAFPEN
jgi:pimeloyl-ACP methyl ester carboxylesterase